MLRVFGDHYLMFIGNGFSSTIKNLNKLRKTAYLSAFILSLLLLATLFPLSFKSATPAEGATKNPQASTLTFSSNSSSASATLEVSSASGSFATSSTNASFSIETNNATGYTLNLKTSDSTTVLSDGNNHTIASINDTKTSSNFTNNSWGLLPSKYNGTNNTTNYYPADNVGFTMDTTSSSNAGTPNTYTVGLGLKADYTIPAGTYTNATVIAEYIANPITYAIYYYTNTTDNVTGMPINNPQVPSSSFPGTTAASTTLASAPTRTGYTFLGWCAGTSSASNITVGTNGAADTCSTTTYDAGQSFGINATGSSSDNYYLYAMWQVNSYTVTITNSNTTTSVNSLIIPYNASKTVTVTPASGYYLSSVTCPSGVTCTGYNTGISYTGQQTMTITNNTATNSSGTLAFVAEEPKTYMQDMTFADCQKNVGTNGNETNVGDSIKVYDKRDESDYTIRYINNACWMTQNLRITGTISSTNSNFSTQNSWNVHVGDLTAGNSYTEARSHVPTTTDSNGYTVKQLGAWYNYCAASAGTVCDQTQKDATEDICPAGWHLPSYITTPGAFVDIVQYRIAFRSIFGGYYYNGSLNAADAYGLWWSSTARNGSDQYYLSDDDGSLLPYSGSKSLGSYIRCVMKPTMQDATATSLASAMPNNGDTTTLIDSRDKQDYTIAKIGGKYWMTKNLNLAGGTKLSYNDTNVPENWSTNTTGFTNGNTLPASSPNGFTNNAAAYVYNSGSTTCGNNSPCYSYYSWRAATAGYNTSTDGQSVSYDICPKGWRLPTSTEASSLRSTYTTGSTLTASPFKGVYSAYQYNSKFTGGGTYGFYWTSTSYDGSFAYYLFYSSSYSTVANDGNKSNGNAIRCVANV